MFDIAKNLCLVRRKDIIKKLLNFYVVRSETEKSSSLYALVPILFCLLAIDEFQYQTGP